MYWDFSTVLITPRNDRLTAADGDILVEIGFGNGEFLQHLARTRRDALVVGIEVSSWCLCKAARRTVASGVPNVRLLHGDARALLVWAFEPGVVSEVYMNFPCPWPKRKHAARRVSSAAFPRLMRRSLTRGGMFTLATDVDWYAAETREAFAMDGAFDTGQVLVNPPREYKTKYERKWREMGRDTYTVTAVKITEEHEMDGHEIQEQTEIEGLGGEISPTIRSLEGEKIEGREYRVIFREVFFSGDGSALVSAISVDEGFEQHYFLRLTPTPHGLRGRVDSVGFPYRTPGVRASVRYVMERAGAKF